MSNKSSLYDVNGIQLYALTQFDNGPLDAHIRVEAGRFCVYVAPEEGCSEATVIIPFNQMTDLCEVWRNANITFTNIMDAVAPPRHAKGILKGAAAYSSLTDEQLRDAAIELQRHSNLFIKLRNVINNPLPDAAESKVLDELAIAWCKRRGLEGQG